MSFAAKNIFLQDTIQNIVISAVKRSYGGKTRNAREKSGKVRILRKINRIKPILAERKNSKVMIVY